MILLYKKFKQLLAKRHNLRAHFWQTMANYTQHGGALVTSVILARFFTPAEFGSVIFGTAIVRTVFLLSKWSVNPLLLTEQKRKVQVFYRCLSFAFAVFWLRLLLLSLMVIWFYLKQDFLTLYVVLLAGLHDLPTEIINTYKAYHESKRNFRINFLASIVMFLLGLFVPILGYLIGLGPISLVLGGPLISIIVFIVYFWRFGLPLRLKVDFSLLRKQVFSGFYIWLDISCLLGIVRVDKLFVGAAYGDATLGNYNRAFSFAPVTGYAFHSLVSNPMTKALTDAGSVRKKLAIIYKTVAILMCAGILTGLVWVYFSEPIVIFLFGKKWVDAIPYFEAFAFLGLGNNLASLSTSALTSERAFKELGLLRTVGFLTLLLILFAGWFKIEALLVCYLMLLLMLGHSVIGLGIYLLKIRNKLDQER